MKWSSELVSEPEDIPSACRVSEGNAKVNAFKKMKYYPFGWGYSGLEYFLL